MANIDFTGLPAFHSTEEVLAHPRFPFARDEFVKAMFALYEQSCTPGSRLTSLSFSKFHGANFTSPFRVKTDVRPVV